MSQHEPAPTVALVSMPFHGCTSPSMALGLLKAILSRAGIASRIYNFNLDFLRVALPDPVTASEREIEFEHLPLPASGEWVFRPPGSQGEERQSALELAGTLEPDEDIAMLLELRRKVEPFVEECAARLLLGGHDILCFSASNMQTRAALRVAEAVRRRAPGARVVLGGASAFGIKGRALIQAFPLLDVVCHGEADLLVEPIIRGLRGEPGCSLEGLRGLSFRRADGSLSLGQDDGPRVNLDELPPPDHSEWVEQVTAMVQAGAINPRARLSLTFETARGCWWAGKHQCSFCSLAHPAFRAKSPERVTRELETLSARHRLRAFYCVDNNLAPGYFHTVLPALAGRGYALLWNVKAHLTRRQITLLAKAGVVSVVVGIESLITPTLSLMRKGTTALQNIQALKWFSELRIFPVWNYISHVPGEQLAWLRNLARLLPRLMHLPPPLPARIEVERESPYFADPSRYGIELRGPEPQHRLAFAELAPELVAQLSHAFEYTLLDRDPEVDRFFGETIWPLIVEWRERYFAGRACTLSVVHGPLESVVLHGPFWAPGRVVRARGALRSLLLACERVRSERSLAGRLAQAQPGETLPAALYDRLLRSLGRTLEPELQTGGDSLEETLAAADAAALIVREDGRALALPVNQTGYVQTPASQRRLALRALRDLYVRG